MNNPLVPLGEVVDVFSGFAWKSSGFNSEGKGVPIIRIQNVAQPDSDFVYWDDEYQDRFLINRGDLLLSLSGSFRIDKWSGPVSLLNQRVVKLTPEERLDADFFRHFMQSQLLEIEALGRHALVNNVSVADLKKIEVPLPPLPEQRRIAATLDKADSLRAKRREAIAKLDQLMQSVFLEMFGDPITNPMGWPMTCFGEVCESSFRNGLSPSTDGTVPGKVLTLSAITGHHFQSQHQKEASFDRPPSDNQRVKTDTFLICRGNGSRQLVGVGVFPSHDLLDVCFPDTIIGANIAKHCSPRFIEQIWASRWMREQIESSARTTNGTFKINQKTLERLSIPIPPRELQFHFDSVCTKLMALRAMMSVNAELINENIRSLQQRVFGAL